MGVQRRIGERNVGWDHVEVRVDEACSTASELKDAGYAVGDFCFDSTPEITPTGFINARYLDGNAGVAILLAAAKAVKTAEVKAPVNCYLLFRHLRGCRVWSLLDSLRVPRYYRSDSASAIEAGSDTRNALVGFGLDASHSSERSQN